MRLRLVTSAAVFVIVLPGSDFAVQAAPTVRAVKACYKKKTGAVRVATRRKPCKRGERRITLGRRGSRGPRGSQGPPGPAGPIGSSGGSPQAGTGTPGAQGPTGAAGSPGPAGSTGPTGATGPTGPSSSTEARNPGPVSITGTDGGSANSLVTLSGVAPGNYLLVARAQLNSSPTLASEIVCEASLGGKSTRAIANVGTNAGNTAHDVVMLTFNVTLASTGTANLNCFGDSLSGTAPTASSAYLELLQVGSAVSQTVSG